MTGDLLQSDIDLARRMIAGGESDADIVVALGYRKIPAEKALRLARTLRSGLDVRPDPLEPSGQKWESSVESVPQISPAHPARTRSREIESGFSWFRLILLAVVALSIVAVFVLNHQSTVTVGGTTRELMVEPTAALRRPVLQVEIESNALRVCGTVLSRTNALKTLFDLAGPPARTNRVEDVTIYAFDQQGTVLYSGGKSAKDSLLLYFEPVGGNNGAEHAFTGTFSIEGNPITLTTTPTTLRSVRQMQLKETVTNVFSAQYNQFALSFAYLKPERLSFVAIDLE